MRISDWSSDVCSSDLFDLMAQVAAEHMECAAAFDVGRTAELAVIPIATGFVFAVGFAEHGGALREMTAEDARVRPQIANQVGDKIEEQHARRVTECQQGERHEVLQQLFADLFV